MLNVDPLSLFDRDKTKAFNVHFIFTVKFLKNSQGQKHKDLLLKKMIPSFVSQCFLLYLLRSTNLVSRHLAFVSNFQFAEFADRTLTKTSTERKKGQRMIFKETTETKKMNRIFRVATILAQSQERRKHYFETKGVASATAAMMRDSGIEFPFIFFKKIYNPCTTTSRQ